MKKPFIIIFLVLFLDQALKFWVKTNMFLGQEFPVFDDWFVIHFTENNGMAFGWSFSEGTAGKLFLSLFRILAVGGIGYYLFMLIKEKTHPGYITCISLILAGAFGNIIDSVFYGILFSDSSYQVAEFLPETGGYAPFLQGKVVDMFYFPIIEGHFPEWFPFWAGEDFIFFRPVFNLADSAITIGVLLIILFQSRFFHKEKDAPKQELQSSAGEQSTY